jgi:hypothetical protein
VWLLPLLLARATLSGCARSMMPAPLIYRDSGSPIFGELAPERRDNRIPVLFVTDRKPAVAETRGSRF